MRAVARALCSGLCSGLCPKAQAFVQHCRSSADQPSLRRYDIGRIEDVHFNPWYSDGHPFYYWQTTHGRAFVFGRSDWEYVFNTFAFAYAIGYHFIERETGSMNGNFLGIGMDAATNASVQVDQSQVRPRLHLSHGLVSG